MIVKCIRFRCDFGVANTDVRSDTWLTADRGLFAEREEKLPGTGSTYFLAEEWRAELGLFCSAKFETTREPCFPFKILLFVALLCSVVIENKPPRSPSMILGIAAMAFREAGFINEAVGVTRADSGRCGCGIVLLLVAEALNGLVLDCCWGDWISFISVLALFCKL